MTVVTLPWWEVLVRLLAASVCGGIIGIDRGKKHRPAGFRTHMLVCMGAALTILLSTYLCAMLTGSLWNLNPGEVMITTDVSRFGAQVSVLSVPEPLSLRGGNRSRGLRRRRGFGRLPAWGLPSVPDFIRRR